MEGRHAQATQGEEPVDACTGGDAESATLSESSSREDDSDDESSLGDSSSCSDLDLEKPPTHAEKKAGLFLSLEMVQMLRLSTSEGNLFSQLPAAEIAKMTPARRTSGGAPTMSRMVFALQTKSPMESHPQHAAKEASVIKPKDTLKQILEEQHIAVQYRKYSDVPDYFVTCCVSSHSLELMTAVRRNDLAAIIRQHEAGHNLQCANKFQESLVHAVARRGHPDMLTYLTEVAGVSLRVCCDGGRTALHDACWTGQPDFTTIRILLVDSPDLLFITDKRNFTPLDYIPQEAHESWNAWLRENKQLLRPRVLD